jgi:recombinational DNA repair protein RecT
MNNCDHTNVYTTLETDKAIVETCKDCGEVFTMAKKPAIVDAVPEPGAPATTKLPATKPVDSSPYGIIETHLRTKELTSRVTLALGYNANDEAGKSEAFKYISSVLMEIQKTVGSDRDLTVCTPISVVQAIVDAASFRLPIDGRQLAYLVKYKDRASFQPGYKGLLFKISEMYKDVDFTAEPVFKGDDLALSDNGGFQSYTHTKKSPFQNDMEQMEGVIACLSYNGEGGRHSKVVAISHAEIKQIRSSAKQDFIWKAWFFEKAKAAALKRLCKVHFTTALGLQTLVQFDNEEHFDMGPAQATDITPAKPTEKLNALFEKQQAKGNAA